MRKLVAFLLTGLALYGAHWSAAHRLFDEGPYRKQVAFGSVFVPFGWAYALGFLGALVLLVLLYSLLYTALVNRLQGRRKSPWPLFLQGVTHLFLWVLILLVYYPVVQVVAASFDPTNNLFSFRRPDTGFLLVDAKVIPYLPNPSLENYAKLVEGVVLYPYQVALALLAGLALREAVGVGGLKWPNDLLAPDGGKLAGVLLEARAEGEEVSYALLGVGVNVAWAPEGAACLQAYAPLSRREVLEGFLLKLEALLPLLETPEALLERYRQASLTLGRKVRVHTGKGVVEGLAEDVLPDATLLVGGVRGGPGEVEPLPLL